MLRCQLIGPIFALNALLSNSNNHAFISILIHVCLLNGNALICQIDFSTLSTFFSVNLQSKTSDHLISSVNNMINLCRSLEDFLSFKRMQVKLVRNDQWSYSPIDWLTAFWGQTWQFTLNIICTIRKGVPYTYIEYESAFAKFIISQLEQIGIIFVNNMFLGAFITYWIDSWGPKSPAEEWWKRRRSKSRLYSARQLNSTKSNKIKSKFTYFNQKI